MKIDCQWLLSALKTIFFSKTIYVFNLVKFLLAQYFEGLLEGGGNNIKLTLKKKSIIITIFGTFLYDFEHLLFL